MEDLGQASSSVSSAYRGRGRNTPQEHIGFEYRIDRKHRVLRRDHMFPNLLHPSLLQMTEDFYVSNSIHSHNLRVGLERVAPGASFQFPDYPNEHLLLQVGGLAELHIDEETISLAPGDQVFTPAFMSYRYVNTCDDHAWLLSGYARVEEWLGTEQAVTAVKPGCEAPRFVPAATGTADKEGEGWRCWRGLAGSRNDSRTIALSPGGALRPQHLAVEQIVFMMSGTIDWHVDGFDHRLTAQDLLFIPAMTPFSARACDAEARFVAFDVQLAGR